MKTNSLACKVCQAPKDGHRHCSGCKAEIRTGVFTKHSDVCYKAKQLKPEQTCVKHSKLLAAGAHCPNCEAERACQELTAETERLLEGKPYE